MDIRLGKNAATGCRERDRDSLCAVNSFSLSTFINNAQSDRLITVLIVLNPIEISIRSFHIQIFDHFFIIKKKIFHMPGQFKRFWIAESRNPQIIPETNHINSFSLLRYAIVNSIQHFLIKCISERFHRSFDNL